MTVHARFAAAVDRSSEVTLPGSTCGTFRRSDVPSAKEAGSIVMMPNAGLAAAAVRSSAGSAIVWIRTITNELRREGLRHKTAEALRSRRSACHEVGMRLSPPPEFAQHQGDEARGTHSARCFRKDLEKGQLPNLRPESPRASTGLSGDDGRDGSNVPAAERRARSTCRPRPLVNDLRNDLASGLRCRRCAKVAVRVQPLRFSDASIGNRRRRPPTKDCRSKALPRVKSNTYRHRE